MTAALGERHTGDSIANRTAQTTTLGLAACHVCTLPNVEFSCRRRRSAATRVSPHSSAPFPPQASYSSSSRLEAPNYPRLGEVDALHVHVVKSSG
jgi:hypothetical protein